MQAPIESGTGNGSLRPEKTRTSVTKSARAPAISSGMRPETVG